MGLLVYLRLGMDFLHKMAILHRDLKTDNLLVIQLLSESNSLRCAL